MSKLRFGLLEADVTEGMFDCGVASINEYVVHSYLATLLQHGYAYQIFYEKIVIGYYMITFSHIRIEDCPEAISDFTSGLSDFLYSVEIKYLAIDKRYQKRKIGTNVLASIVKSIKDCAQVFPIRLITIDARVDLVRWYEKMGFVQFPSNVENQNGYTVKMYIDCLLRQKELEEYIESVT